MTTEVSELCCAYEKAAERTLSEMSWATGLSIAVTDRTEVIAQSTHGLADLAAKRPVTSNTLFEIGSISKGFTAALLLQAQEAGLLDLDEPIATYLPWFSVKSRFSPITVRHLLTHTAGIVCGTEFTGEATFEVWCLRDTEATTPPGTWFYYSNTGYKALGALVQAVYGRPYERVLGERLLKPLGMSASEPAITHDSRRRMAVGYEPFYDDRPPRRADGLVPATWLETATGDGSIASTATDMTAWLRCLMNGGTGPNDVPVLQAAGVREMLTPAIAADEPSASYGLGMFIKEVEGRQYVSHGGGMVGYSAAVTCDLERGLGAVVLANGSGPWEELADHAILSAHALKVGAAPPDYTVTRTMSTPDEPAPQSEKATPTEWAPLLGHYRCYNPWQPNFRVRCHAGQLWLWGGEYDTHLGEPLIELADGSFRIGKDERSPERIRFDVLIDGLATRATVAGCAYYRTFTS